METGLGRDLEGHAHGAENQGGLQRHGVLCRAGPADLRLRHRAGHPGDGAREGLRLYPGDRRAIGAGKILANVLFLAAMEALVVPMAGILYSIDLWTKLPALAGIFFLATLGFAAVGTFYAALTANLRAREVMLPLLLFPVMVPVILAAVKATSLVLNGDLMGELSAWVRLLVVFDMIFVTVCTFAFGFVMEE